MKKAYTLLEILITIAIISILIAIVFPIYNTIRISSYKIKSISNIKQLGMAWKMYSEDNDDNLMRFWYYSEYWFGNNKGSILNSYIDLKNIKDPGLKFYNINAPDYWIGYGYNGVFLSCCNENDEIKDVKYSEINNPANTAVFTTVAGLFTVNKKEELYPISIIYPSSYNLPSVHGRYNNTAPILWADLHASSKTVTYFNLTQKYKKLNLGYLDQDQNINTDELLDLE